MRYTLPFTERQYISLGVNMLKNNLKISDTTKTEFFELISFQSDLEKGEIYCLADLSSVSYNLTCWFSFSFLSRGFLAILSNPAFCSL